MISVDMLLAKSTIRVLMDACPPATIIVYLRGVIFVVYNFHPVQKPAGAGLAVVMPDPQFLQGAQVDSREVENVLLGHMRTSPATEGQEMSQVYGWRFMRTSSFIHLIFI